MGHHALVFLLVFIGGGLGSMLRHAVNQASAAMLGINFPFGTLFVNIIGSLVWACSRAGLPFVAKAASCCAFFWPQVFSAGSPRFPLSRSMQLCFGSAAKRLVLRLTLWDRSGGRSLVFSLVSRSYGLRCLDRRDSPCSFTANIAERHQASQPPVSLSLLDMRCIAL